jgi:hypothetical protein
MSTTRTDAPRKLVRPIRPVRKPAVVTPQAQALPQSEPLTPLAVLTKRMRFLDAMTDRIAAKLTEAEARATLDDEKSVEALHTVLSELLRMHDKTVDAAKEAAIYSHHKLSTSPEKPDTMRPRASMADLHAEVARTNDPQEAMRCYLRIMNGDAP